MLQQDLKQDGSQLLISFSWSNKVILQSDSYKLICPQCLNKKSGQGDTLKDGYKL